MNKNFDKQMQCIPTNPPTLAEFLDCVRKLNSADLAHVPATGLFDDIFVADPTRFQLSRKATA